MSPLSSHCKPAQASQGSYWLFLDPPGQAILVAWLPNTVHQPNQSTWDSGSDELPQDLSCSLPSISSRGTFFFQPIWKIPVVSQIFSWGVISLLKSTLISLGHVQYGTLWISFVYHTYYNIHIAYCIVILIFNFLPLQLEWNLLWAKPRSPGSSLWPILRSAGSDSLWKQEKAKRRQFFSRNPRGMSPAHIFILSACEPFWTSDLQHWEINLHRFKPLILWLR